MKRLARLPGMDGLRGMAVLAVMGYHLNLGHFLPAGFLGVDLFFTVSGFIITALLLQEHAQTGRIAFAAFYWRRARRLLPAAFAMLLVLLAVTPVFLPAAWPRLLEDLPAAFLYASNWWQIVAQQSYFESLAQPRLLQHLWSLAVEEQYYLLWPLAALYLLNKTGREGLGWVAGLIALASTGWMAWLYATHAGVGGDPSRVYLGTDTHLMGLLAGSALACVWNPWKARMATLSSDHKLNLLGLAAWVGLIWLMSASHEGMPWLYQGGFLLAAVLSSMLIVAATLDGTWLAKLLSTQPMQWLGARSYSIYLWHWPVVVWLPAPAQDNATTLWWVTVSRILLTLACAEISYRFVETPWRSALPSKTWQRASVLVSSSLLLLSATSAALMPTQVGSAGQTPDFMQGPTEVAAPSSSKHGATPTSATASSWSSDPTHNPPPHAQPHISLVGDSVLLGASPYLTRRLPSSVVEAKTGRQGSEGLKVLNTLRQKKQLGPATVVHLGTNGYLTEAQIRDMLQSLEDRQTVVVVNVYAARRWTEPNNAMLARMTQHFSNVRLVDWHAAGKANPGYFVSDGIHLTSQGIRAYSDHIRIALGQPDTLFKEPQASPLKPAPPIKNAPSAEKQSASRMAENKAKPNAADEPGQPTIKPSPASQSAESPMPSSTTSASTPKAMATAQGQ